MIRVKFFVWMTSSSRNPQIDSWIALILFGSMRSSFIFQIYHVQMLIFSIDTCTGIKCKKLLLMLYVHWIRVVSSSCRPRRNIACVHIHSSHIGCFFGSVSNIIYRWVMKYQWCIKKLIVDVQYVFVLESQVWNKDHTVFLRLLCVFWWSEPMPFAVCLWGFDILLLGTSKSRTQLLGPMDLDTEQDPVELIDTHI